MGTFAGLGAIFVNIATNLPHAGKAGLERGAVIVETAAKEAIGGYSFGWPALAASTIERKGADTPLLETSALRDSIQHSVGDHVAYVGTNDAKAQWQEMGTSRIPPRPFLSEAARRKSGEVAHAIGAEVTATMTHR